MEFVVKRDNAHYLFILTLYRLRTDSDIDKILISILFSEQTPPIKISQFCTLRYSAEPTNKQGWNPLVKSDGAHPSIPPSKVYCAINSYN